ASTEIVEFAEPAGATLPLLVPTDSQEMASGFSQESSSFTTITMKVSAKLGSMSCTGVGSLMLQPGARTKPGWVSPAVVAPWKNAPGVVTSTTRSMLLVSATVPATGTRTIVRSSLAGLIARLPVPIKVRLARVMVSRSEEHTSELQSRENLVCRLLLEKK